MVEGNYAGCLKSITMCVILVFGLLTIVSIMNDDAIAEDISDSDISFELETTISAHNKALGSIGWSSDDKYLASGGWNPDNRLKIWDTSDWSLLKNLTGDDSYGVVSIEWNQDDSYLLTAGYDHHFRVWNTSSWSVYKKIFQGSGNNGWVKMTKWSPDEKLIASACTDGRVRIWNTTTWNCIKTLSGHTHWVYNLDWSPDGNYLATGARDEKVIIWETENWSSVKTLTDTNINGLSWSPDQEYLLYPSKNSVSPGIYLYYTNNWTMRKKVSTDYLVGWVSFSPDGKYFGGCSSNGFSIFNTENCSFITKLSPNAAQAKWSHSGDRLAVGRQDGRIDIYSIKYDDNNLPIADANGPYSGYEGSEINFNANKSYDPDGDDLQYRWDLDNDGTWDTNYSSDPTVNHTWYDDHSGYVTVEVYDGISTDTDTVEVTIYNVDPTVSFEYTVPEMFVLPGERIYFIGEFFDPGTEDTHTINWSFGDGNYLEGDLEVNHSFDDPGTYNVTLTVTDDDGGVGYYSAFITVIGQKEALEDLIDYIEDLGLNNGIQTSLVKKLENAIKKIDKGEDVDLKSFFNELDALKGNKISNSDYEYLYSLAQRIVSKD